MTQNNSQSALQSFNKANTPLLEGETSLKNQKGEGYLDIQKKKLNKIHNFLVKYSLIGWMCFLSCMGVIAIVTYVSLNTMRSLTKEFEESKINSENHVLTMRNTIDSTFEYFRSLQTEIGEQSAFIQFGLDAIDNFYRSGRGPYGVGTRRLTLEERRLVLNEIWILSNTGRFAGTNPFLALSYMLVESGFGPNAVSRAGAIGLFQFMPLTADAMMREYFPNDYNERVRGDVLWRPRQSILVDPIWSTRLWFAHYDYLFRVNNMVFSNSPWKVEYIALAYNGGANRPDMIWFAFNNRSPDQFVASGGWRGDGITNSTNHRYDKIIRNWYDFYREAWETARISILAEFDYREVEILFETPVLEFE